MYIPLFRARHESFMGVLPGSGWQPCAVTTTLPARRYNFISAARLARQGKARHGRAGSCRCNNLQLEMFNNNEEQ